MSLTVYKASAGSGKTYTLTHAFVRRLLTQDSPTGYLHQLALTFTRKATEEMKLRILSLLNDLSLPSDDERGVRLREAFCREEGCGSMDEEMVRRRAVALRSAMLHDYGRFSVYTIDAFFQRIVRSFIWEAGLSPAYSVELDSQRLLQEAIDQVVDEVVTNKQNRRWIGAILSERILDGRRWNVQEAFAEVGKQVFDERFRALGQKFINQLCDKEFLSSYMEELRSWDDCFKQQMERYAEEVLTFVHGVGLCTTDFKGKSRSFMRYFDKVKEGVYTPSHSLRSVLDDCSLWVAKNDSNAIQIESNFYSINRLIHKCIDFYDAQAPIWFAVGLALKWLPQMALAADISGHINALLSDYNTVHLNQTLLLLSALASQSDAPFILERMGCRYSDFLLDEFQDTSVLQWKVLHPLIHNGLAQGGVSLVVGDVKQSIYRWRNSDWRILGGSLHDDLHIFNPIDKTLNTNYRSREALVHTVGNLCEHLIEVVYQDFLTALPQTVSPQETACFEAIPLEIKKAYADVRQQIAPTQMERGGYVSIYNVTHNKEQSAKEQVLERLPGLIMELQDRGFSASDIAILVRKNEEGQQVAAALTAAKLMQKAQHYCFEVVSPDSLFLTKSPEIQLIISIFKWFVSPQDQLNNRLMEQLCVQLDVKCSDLLWNGALSHYALSEAFEEILRILKWTERCAAFPFIQELHNQILTFDRRVGNQAADIFSFIRWWNQNGNKITLKLERSGHAIEILTIHKAKGLEYPVVIIPFCEWGLDYMPTHAPLLWAESQQEPFQRLPFFPQRYGPDMAQSLFAYDYFYEKMQCRVDVLNIFYVATTRAKDELHLFLPQPKHTSYNIASLLQQELFADDPTTYHRTFGAPVTPLSAPSTTPDTTTPLTRYPSASPSLRLYTRLADESPAVEEVSPRRRGIILHRLLSLIRTRDDINAAILELVEDGFFAPDQEEQASYKQMLHSALSQPQAATWFDGSWTLRNEASILLPAANGQTVRPDRVMQKEGRTVVIDYKFGAPRPAHQRQMDEYVRVLNQMGYKGVEGYVWYI